MSILDELKNFASDYFIWQLSLCLMLGLIVGFYRVVEDGNRWANELADPTKQSIGRVASSGVVWFLILFLIPTALFASLAFLN